MRKYQCVINKEDVTVFLNAYNIVGGYIEFIPESCSPAVTIVTDNIFFFRHAYFKEMEYKMPIITIRPEEAPKAPVINVNSLVDRVVIDSDVDSERLREKIYHTICKTMTDVVNEVCKPEVPVDFYLNQQKEFVKTSLRVRGKKELINHVKAAVNKFPDNSRFELVLYGTVVLRSDFSGK